MDIVAIERAYFDSFRKKLEQIISLADNTSLSPSDMCIEKEWIEGKTLACFAKYFFENITVSTGEWQTFFFDSWQESIL